MNSEQILSCPICENENFTLFLRTKDYTVTQDEFELRKCTHCNFIVTSPRPTENNIEKYYDSENYISHAESSKTLFDKIYFIARSVSLKWKFNIINLYLNGSGAVLDFGCGTGDFLNFIKEKSSIKVLGVEPNHAARIIANHKLHGRVFQNLQSLKDKSLDAITLWHVLEHVHQLNDTLQNLKRLLSNNGHLIIAVPNHQSHDSLKYKDAWAAYDVPRHLWHFNQKTMKALLHRNGFRIISIKPMKLDSFYVSLLSESYKKPYQLKVLTGAKAFLEGCRSNLYAMKDNQYSSLIYIAKQE